MSDDGRVLAANRSALFQLGLQSMDDIRMRRVDDIFQNSLEDILTRISDGVPFGTRIPYQAVARYSGSPAASATVGTSGSDAMR